MTPPRAGRSRQPRLQPPNAAFEARVLRVDDTMPKGGTRALLYTITGLLAVAALGLCAGQVDMVAVANGKLVPSTLLKVVQPTDAGVIREILVREGMAVSAGQVIFRMDTRLSEADRRILDKELALRRLQLRRIEAELAGTAFDRRPDDAAALFTEVLAQFNARRRAFLDAVEAERSALARTTQELRSAEEVEGKLRRVAPIYKEQEQAWEQLAKEGYAGKLLALERSRSRIENEQDLSAQVAAVSSAKAAMATSERRIAQIESSYRRELSNERVDALAQVERLREDLAKQSHRNEQLELRAPTAGVVKDLATHTGGTVVAPGTILATIVPREEPLEAEVWVENLDAARVAPGARVELKVGAYPYQRFGTVAGTVRHLSADATERPDTASAMPGSTGLYYRALISIDRAGAGTRADPLRLVPGMQLSAEVHLGTRSVLDYLLSPLRRTLQEAGREP